MFVVRYIPRNCQYYIFHVNEILQDTRENMEKHRDSKEYVKWNLENTATLLSEQFPCSHVFVIRPVR